MTAVCTPCGYEMKAVTESGVWKVLQRLMQDTDKFGDHQVSFKNLDGTVDYAMVLYQSLSDDGTSTKYYVGLMVDLYEDSMDMDDVVASVTAKHPALQAWVLRRFDGEPELYQFGPVNEQLRYVETDRECFPELMKRIRELQNLKLCSCAKDVYFDDADFCLSCQLTATPEDLQSEICCVCQCDAFKMHSVTVNCCGKNMHKECYKHVTSESFGKNRLRCPMCRGMCLLRH